MREIAGELLDWADAGAAFAVASIVGVRGSAPRGVGAAMAVRSDGTVVGSLSGGCVEGSVHALALRSLETGEPVRSGFTYDPDDPFAVGLTCGGELDVHIRPVPHPQLSDTLIDALRAVADGHDVALARVLDSGAARAVVSPGFGGAGSAPSSTDNPGVPGVLGSTGDPDLDARVAAEAEAMLKQGVSGTRRICRPARDGGAAEEHEVFVESWTSPPRMLVFGAIDHAAALTRIGGFLGYRVTVCDARAVFATSERFPDADEVVVRWPHEYLADTEVDQRTVICVLTHDVKFDVPVLVEALSGPAAYVGALGSRGTHADRIRRLRAAGLGDAELRRLRAPIGLDLGGRTPEETAVSIAAEIIAMRTRASTMPLTDTSGPIHAHA